MMEIRPFQATDEQYNDILAIHREVRSEEQLTVTMMRQNDDGVETLVRFLCEENGSTVAHGAYSREWGDEENGYRFSLFALPEWQNGRVPAQLQAHLLNELKGHNPTKIISEPTEDETYRTKLLEEAGFELKMRFPRSQLRVAQFNTADYNHFVHQFANQNIRLTTLADVMETDPNWQRNVWRLFTIIDQDVPYPDPQKSISFEDYARYYEEDFLPESWALALDLSQIGEDQYIGMSVVNPMSSRPDTLFAGITGVVPAYRRRKIATALKVQSVKFAQQNRFRYIYTDNEEHNPMYQLNLQLGFDPLPAWVYYER